MANSMDVVPPNGFPLTNPLKLTSEIHQYDRLLKLRDDIVAGTHPRIKLNATASPNGNSHTVAGSNGLHANGIAQNVLTKTNALPGLQPPLKSTHDSDTISRSKIRLERQRIERNICESLKDEKDGDGQYGLGQEVLADFDVTEVFFQAQDTAKALLQQKKQPASDSVSNDEETFYSSGAGTDGTEDLNTKNLTSRPPCKFFFRDGKCKKGDACESSHHPAFKQQLQKVEATQKEVGATQGKLPSRPGYTAQGGRIRESPNYQNTEEGEMADEAPYSPAMHIAVEDLSRLQMYNPIRKARGGFNNTPPNGSRANNRQKGKYPYRGKDAQIIRNHITSPAAPQASRVSPLAVAKVPRIDRGRNDQNRAGHQNREPFNQQGPGSRKRRRDDESNDNARNVAPRTTMASPEPYIKPEPMSPPPISVIPQQPRSQFDNSPRNNDRSPFEGVSNIGAGGMTPKAVPTPFEPRRVISGPVTVSDSRRTQDLRRIVSTRNFERAPSPGYEGRFRPRTSSRVILAREEAQSMPYRASMQPQRQTYVVDDRSLSPPVRYARRLEEPELIPMPPPSGRVVVDNYGNRYLETMMSDRRDVMVPETRYVSDVRHRADNLGSLRASVRPDTYYEEQRIYQSDPPQSARANIGPEVRYVEERSRPYETLPRVSVRPEARYYEGRFAQGDPEPRATNQVSGTRPEARSGRMSVKPSSEQFNAPSRNQERVEYDRSVQLLGVQSPRIQPQPLDYRASLQPIARSTYETNAPRQTQQEYQQLSDVCYRRQRADEDVPMVENVGRMSVRPMDNLGRASVRPVIYDERDSRQSVDAERVRYQEVRERETYVPSRRPPYGRQEFIDPPPGARTAYRYVSTTREPGPSANTYDNSHMYLD